MTDDELIDRLTAVVQQQLDGVYQIIDSLRDEFSQTVTVLDSNDRAVMAELQRVKGSEVEGLANDAGEAWQRFITSEYARLNGTTGPEPQEVPSHVPVAKS